MIALNLLLTAAFLSPPAAEPFVKLPAAIKLNHQTPLTLENAPDGSEVKWDVTGGEIVAGRGTFLSKKEGEVKVIGKVGNQGYPGYTIAYDRDAEFNLGSNPQGSGGKVTVRIGDELTLRATRKSGSKFGVVKWEFDSSENLEVVSPADSPLKDQYRIDTSFRVKAIKVGETKVKVRSFLNAEKTAEFTVVVLDAEPDDAAVKLTKSTVRAGVPTEIEVKGFGADGFTASADDKIFETTDAQGQVQRASEINSTGKLKIKAVRPGSINLTLNALPTTAGGKSYKRTLTVSSRITRLALTPVDSTSSTLFLSQRQTYKLVAYADNVPAPEVKITIKSAAVEPAGTANEPEILPNGLIRITPISGAAAKLVVTATLNEEDGTEIPAPEGEVFIGEAAIRVIQVTGFQNIRVQLVPMDDVMVQHLYGAQTRAQFYVYQVRINNNLLDERGQPAQKSILAYSASLGTGVTLEKMAKDPRQRAADSKRANVLQGWCPVTVRDYDTQFSHVSQLGNTNATEELEPGEFGLTPRIKTQLVGEPQTFLVQAGKAARVITSVIYQAINRETGATISIGKARDVNGKLVREAFNGSSNREFLFMPACVGTYVINATVTYDEGDQKNQVKHFHAVTQVVDPASANKVFTYNPYRFAIMESTSSIRAEADGRNQIVSVMEALGNIGTFILNVFDAKGQVPNLISNWSNVLIPGYRRLKPNLTELQRANLIRDIMQPIEEVAYGQDIERTVFFPRGQFSGVIRGYNTRISAIDVSRYQIQIAVVESKATVNGSGQTGNTGNGGGGEIRAAGNSHREIRSRVGKPARECGGRRRNRANEVRSGPGSLASFVGAIRRRGGALLRTQDIAIHP